MIVRAIGPSLGNANPPVPGALADPTLESHNADGSVLASNHNWRDTQEAEIRHSLGRSVQHQPVIAVWRAVLSATGEDINEASVAIVALRAGDWA